MADNSYVSFGKLRIFLEKVKGLINMKQDKQMVEAGTLLASSWSNGTYSFEGTYPSSEYDLEVYPSDAASSDQITAFISAMIVGNAATNVLTAKASAPTVDIPILLKVVKK